MTAGGEREAPADEVVCALAEDKQFRVLAAVTTVSAEEARRRHDLLPTAAAALGRLLTVGALMGALLKADGRLLLQVIGDGPLRFAIAEADAHGRVRGYVGNPHVHMELNRHGKLDVAAAVGRGHLYVIRDSGLGEPYRGVVPLASGEIGEDFAYYFSHSEQIPSAVAVGVLVETDNSVRAAGGLLVQSLPGAAPASIGRLEEQVMALPPISRQVDQGLRPEDLVLSLFASERVRWLTRRPVGFACPCSRERFEEALVALGEKELGALAEQGQAELVCHFCNERYLFDKSDLKRLVACAQGSAG